MDTLVSRARKFAEAAHGSIDQRRKYSNEPYIVHCAEVAKLVATVPHTDEMLAAAWLHDTVEDVPTVTFESIEATFGPVVGQYVRELTDSPAKGMNREARKAADRQRLWRASPQAKTVKLADFIANTASIARHDPKFGRVYVTEKALTLPVLIDGDPTLLGLAFRTLIQAADTLKMDLYPTL